MSSTGDTPLIEEAMGMPGVPGAHREQALKERAVLAAESNARAQHLIAEGLARIASALEVRAELERLKIKAQMGRMTSDEERKTFG